MRRVSTKKITAITLLRRYSLYLITRTTALWPHGDDSAYLRRLRPNQHLLVFSPPIAASVCVSTLLPGAVLRMKDGNSE